MGLVGWLVGWLVFRWMWLVFGFLKMGDGWVGGGWIHGEIGEGEGSMW